MAIGGTSLSGGRFSLVSLTVFSTVTRPISKLSHLMEKVEDGIIDATVTCPTGGTEAIRYAVDIINQVSGIPKQVILRSYRIRQDNVEDYQKDNLAPGGTAGDPGGLRSD